MHSEKGKNPKAYYKNIISVNMMRFSGRQTVKNMCVITFLIAAALFAVFYVPTQITGMSYAVKKNPIDYTFFYNAEENQIGKDEIDLLAEKHNVKINSYEELDAIALITSEVKRSYDKNNKLFDTYIEKSQYDEFFSESDFNRVSGQNVTINQGEYFTLLSDENVSEFWTKHNDLDLITHPVTDVSESIKFANTVVYSPLSKFKQSRYIISDEDYQRLLQGLPKNKLDHFVLFNVENFANTYDFAKELRAEIILRSSPKSAVINSYDEYIKMQYEARGEKYYGDDYPQTLEPSNNMLYTDWKYYPSFKVLDKQDLIKNMAVFLMLFVYIGVICFAAVAVIAFTRSITIGMDNKQLFYDMKKLGANNQYISRVIKKQLIKIFAYPTIIGSGIIFAFTSMILFFNDRVLNEGEIYGLMVDVIIFTVVALFMYAVYRFAFSKIKRMIEIK